MKRLMLAACAALLTLCAPADAYASSSDDRYFDSRAHVVDARYKAGHAKVRRHATKHHYAKKVVSRRIILPHDRITLSAADEQRSSRRETIQYREPVVTHATVILGGRPSGCPRQFCGCGASLHLFGRIIPALNLAANWLRFPRTLPAPKMAAARRGHVFVLERHISGSTWLVFDANSGRHMSRMHTRSIVGYAIVNPRGGSS